jgi:hypothetical protein
MQAEALAALSRLFAEACNAMVPFVQEHRCWNRVGLHHLAYYQSREMFPALGSQMVCQAIHRVADAYKALRTQEGIPKDQPVPALTFTPTSISFDHRTYSIQGEAYTSQTCSVCGGLGKRVQHRFACSCGNLAHSDVNASRNIARFAGLSSPARGVVYRPEFAHSIHPCAVESSSL